MCRKKTIVYIMTVLLLLAIALTELILSNRFVTTNAYTSDMFKNCPAADEWGHLEH